MLARNSGSHAFSETRPPEEQIWIAEEVDRHIQACLRVVVGEGAGDNYAVDVSEPYGELP